MKKLLIGLAIFSTQAFAASGLSGTYYNPPADTTGWWDGFASTAAYLASNPTASGTFTAASINYGGNDTSSIVSFLGSDGASFSGTNGNMADGVLVLKGWIDLAAGSTTLSVGHDDGFRMFLDGANVAQNGCCGTDNVTFNFANAGWHAFELDYNNAMYGNYSGGANFSLSQNGQTIAASSLSTTSPVPETGNVALLLAGLGLIGVVARRRSTK